MKLSGKIVECALCGAKSEQTFVIGSSSLGSMDLDTRPAENKRSTLKYDTQVCPKCHYVNSNISQKLAGISLTDLRKENYLNLVIDKTVNEEAKKFILSAYLHVTMGNSKTAAIKYLSAAWIFDDLNELENSIKARKKAAILLENYLESNEDFNLAVVLLDIYRRSKDFEKCLNTANELLDYGIYDILLKKIIVFEIELSNNEDNSCHKLSECLEK